MEVSRRTDASSPSGGLNVATGTYTGDGAVTQSIVGVGFQPKFVVIYLMIQTSPYDGTIIGFKADVDGIATYFWWRGVNGYIYGLDMIISLDVDGFTVGDGTGPLGNIFNLVGVNYAYWCFR